MGNPRSWQAVHEAEGPDLVLAADFPVTGRNEGGFAELVPGLGLDCPLWQTVPPTVAPDATTDVEEYLAPWVEEIRRTGRTVRAVLGYCAGSVFAGAVAERVAAHQDPPPRIVLFDPELVDVPTVHLQFGRVIGNMTAVLDAEELSTLEREAQRLAEAAANPAGFAAELFTMFRPIAAKAFERAGLDGGFAAELTDLVGSFMAYLGVAARLDPTPAWANATTITSASQGSGLNRLRAEGRAGDGFVAEEIRFEVEHRDLLRTGGTADAVAKLLEAR
ncbi:hypothetical protein [Amycolatopsis cihanbeyliensis]|uniref:Thioesterase domain-containing protein n=1 Tax=Amycolatopsis cihanbeyliensis TaxID=1128664 RepID=A0A542DJD2_AMYCI|nr:hypothetical protein [Amycolatopsis cihanbeyliensis]TQJ03207.1 hypothetical protein FB471_2958 [Amycolatopsis cihanbeyliensis]WCB87232.1 EfrH [Amycolatopsis cihanbeyliensis]